MRKIGLGLALLASAQLMLLTAPAMADDARSTSDGQASSTSSNASKKKTTGWVLVGVGSAVGIGGIVLDVIAGSKNQVSGEGATGDTSTTQNAKTNLLWAGSTMIVVGALASIYGGSLVISANRAQAAASQDPPAGNAGTGSADPIVKMAQASLANTPTVVIPLVGATF